MFYVILIALCCVVSLCSLIYTIVRLILGVKQKNKDIVERGIVTLILYLIVTPVAFGVLCKILGFL